MTKRRRRLKEIDITLPLWKDDILREIFIFCEVDDLLSVRLTCKTFHNITQIMVLLPSHHSLIHSNIFRSKLPLLFRFSVFYLKENYHIFFKLGNFLSTIKTLLFFNVLLNKDIIDIFINRKIAKKLNSLESISIYHSNISRQYGKFFEEFIKELPLYKRLTLKLLNINSLDKKDFLKNTKIRKLSVTCNYGNFNKSSHFLSNINVSELSIYSNSSNGLLDYIITNKNITYLNLVVKNSFFSGLYYNIKTEFISMQHVYEKLSKYVSDNGIELTLNISCPYSDELLDLINYLKLFIIPLGCNYLKNLSLYLVLDINFDNEVISEMSSFMDELEISSIVYEIEIYRDLSPIYNITSEKMIKYKETIDKLKILSKDKNLNIDILF